MSAYAWNENGETKVLYTAHSWEAVFALAEQFVREWVSSWKMPLIRIYVPIMTTPQNIPIRYSPYLFAIAFDTVSARQVVGGNISFSYTVTGSNPYLQWGGVAQGGDTLTSSTYAGAAMTVSDSGKPLTTADETAYSVIKNAPATGANTLAANYSAANTHTLTADSFSGVSQSGQPEAINKFQSNSNTSFSASVTVTTTNAWLIGAVRTQTSQTAGSNTTIRSANTTDNVIDSNSDQATGSRSMTITTSSGYGIIFVGSIAPFSEAVTVKPASLLMLLGVG